MELEFNEAIVEIRRKWREIISFYASPAKAKANGETSYICPFCNHGQNGDGLTRNPKSRDGNGLKCFGANCDFSGDIIDLIQKKDSCDFMTAANTAAALIGISIAPKQAETGHAAGKGHNSPASAQKAQETPTAAPQRRQAQRIQREPAAVKSADYTAYYKECSARLEDPAAVSYLQARGISLELARIYNLGYDPAWISPAALQHLRAEGKDWTPPTTQRIIMPVSKNHYIARAIDPGVTEYKKMNETGGGAAGIFNLQAVFQAEAGPVFVLEGIFDALSVIEAGAAAIALNSTSNIDSFLKVLEQRQAAAQLVLCLDNDDPGRRAQKKLIDGLERLNVPYSEADIAGPHKDANEALQADRRAFEAAIAEARQTGPKDYLAAFLAKIQTEAYKPYKTELSFFDDLLCGGVVQQSLLVVMAAPGTGKTTLCQQIAEEMAAHKKPVIYINLEMSREQLLAKAISSRLARRSGGKRRTALDILQGYRWTEEDRAAIIAETENYRRTVYPYIKYNTDTGNELGGILKYLNGIGEQAKAAGQQAPAVIVDYLHLIRAAGVTDNQELIKQTVTGLKDYAKNYDTFVIGISATNRGSNSSGRITLESGRDSSNLEYTGDYNLSLNYYDIDAGIVSPSETEKIAELQQEKYRRMIIRVLKGRFVPPGRSANIYFDAAVNLFYGENDFMPADPDRIPFKKKGGQKERRL